MGRSKKEYITSSRANYDRFIKANNIKESELPFSKYTKNIEVCNWMFIEFALATGRRTTLPYGFGDIAVSKKKLKTYKIHGDKKYMNLRIDWAKTKKEGKRIYHTNEHSDGFNYKWYWFNVKAKMYLSDLYVFKPCRYASRAITKYVRNTTKNYRENYLEWNQK